MGDWRRRALLGGWTVFDDGWQRMLERRAASREKLVTQSWVDFFKGWLIEIAVVALIVSVFAFVFWLFR